MNKLSNHIKQEFNLNSENMLGKEIHKKHKEELGLNIPKDYFANSKANILEKVSKQKEIKSAVFSRERIVWFAAASIALIFAVTVFKPNVFPSMQEIPAIVSDTIDNFDIKGLALDNFTIEENEVLIASLFIDDAEIDDFVTDYVLEELVYQEVLSN